MLEARGGLAGDSGDHDVPSGGYLTEPGSQIVATGNVAWRSYGMRASLNTEAIDVFCGVDRHDFEGHGSTEASLGLRRVSGAAEFGLYVEAALRHGFSLDTVSGRRDYDGMAAGIGAILRVNERCFLDLGCTVEWTFDRLDLGRGRERLSDVLFSVGIGVLL